MATKIRPLHDRVIVKRIEEEEREDIPKAESWRRLQPLN